MQRFATIATRLAICACAASPLAAQEAGFLPPSLIEFEGVHELVSAARRHGLLTQRLSYTLTIDETGEPSECELDRDFRRKAVTLSICRPLMKYMKFEPARDAMGQAVPGSYTGSIDFRMWMGADGYIEEPTRD